MGSKNGKGQELWGVLKKTFFTPVGRRESSHLRNKNSYRQERYEPRNNIAEPREDTDIQSDSEREEEATSWTGSDYPSAQEYSGLALQGYHSYSQDHLQILKSNPQNNRWLQCQDHQRSFHYHSHSLYHHTATSR